MMGTATDRVVTERLLVLRGAGDAGAGLEGLASGPAGALAPPRVGELPGRVVLREGDLATGKGNG
ncbi:hypothetical protein H632_c2865p0, partial [Helicosporidium sp. ATCC 50920]